MLNKFRDSLKKSRDNLLGNLARAFSRSAFDDQFWDELEEALILTDMGAQLTEQIMGELKDRAAKEKGIDSIALRLLLADRIANILTIKGLDLLDAPYPKAIILVGVNGAGKTTTMAKLAALSQRAGKSVIFAAADTFRAAAIEQLGKWAKRLRLDIVAHQSGGDPAAVVFDAIAAAKSRGKDIILIDTAGRLQTNRNLIEEVKKIKRVAEREAGKDRVFTILILDSTTGQNGISQAKLFNEALSLNGIILTKLDGTAKGGVAMMVANELHLPIVYTGHGEDLNDLIEFDPKSFAYALLDLEI